MRSGTRTAGYVAVLTTGFFLAATPSVVADVRAGDEEGTVSVDGPSVVDLKTPTDNEVCGESAERVTGSGCDGTDESVEEIEDSAYSDHFDHLDYLENQEWGEFSGYTDDSDHFEILEQIEKAGYPERSEKPEHHEKVKHPEKPKPPHPSEKPDKPKEHAHEQAAQHGLPVTGPGVISLIASAAAVIGVGLGAMLLGRRRRTTRH